MTSETGRSWNRRNLLKASLAAAVILAFPAASAIAAGTQETRGGTWILGDRLSLAALLYAQNRAQNLIDQTLGAAKSIASALGVEVPPFPAKSSTQPATDADVIHYLIKGDGAQIGVALANKYGPDHGVLYEVSVKSNLLIWLYAPGDSLGKGIGDVIKDRCESIHLPQQLWMPVVTLVNNQGSPDAIKDAVFKMHEDVANFYLGKS
jgi:hypothetical protein